METWSKTDSSMRRTEIFELVVSALERAFTVSPFHTNTNNKWVFFTNFSFKNDIQTPSMDIRHPPYAYPLDIPLLKILNFLDVLILKISNPLGYSKKSFLGNSISSTWTISEKKPQLTMSITHPLLAIINHHQPMSC